MRQVLGGYSRAGVDNFDNHPFLGGGFPGGDGDHAVAVHGLGRIDDDVHEHMAQLLCVPQHQGNEGGHLFFHGDIVKQGLVLDEKEGPIDRLIDVQRFHELARLPGKLKQFLDGVPATLGVF